MLFRNQGRLLLFRYSKWPISPKTFRYWAHVQDGDEKDADGRHYVP